jgi:hypothetical protein
MKFATKFLVVFIIFSLNQSPSSAAKISGVQKQCIQSIFNSSVSRSILKSGGLSISQKKSVATCVARIRFFPQNQVAQYSFNYGLPQTMIKTQRVGYLLGKQTLNQLKRKLLTSSMNMYPGLNSLNISAGEPTQQMAYFALTVENALEFPRNSIPIWGDQLMVNWLQNGFPMTKYDLASAIKADSRYGYTLRANLEATALALSFGCAFGNSQACADLPNARARVDALGPLVP